MYGEMDEITINCMIKAKGLDGISKVAIEKVKNVNDLKESISNFENVDVRLWKVNLDTDDQDIKEKIDELQNDDSPDAVEKILRGEKMLGLENIGDNFGNLPEKHIHAIIQGWCKICGVSFNSVKKHLKSTSHKDNANDPFDNEGDFIREDGIFVDSTHSSNVKRDIFFDEDSDDNDDDDETPPPNINDFIYGNAEEVYSEYIDGDGETGWNNDVGKHL